MTSQNDPIERLRHILTNKVNQDGLSRVAAITGVPIGRIRSVIAGRDARVSTLRALCAALGLEMIIRPRPDPSPAREAREKSARSPFFAQTPEGDAEPATHYPATIMRKIRDALDLPATTSEEDLITAIHALRQALIGLQTYSALQIRKPVDNPTRASVSLPVNRTGDSNRTPHHGPNRSPVLSPETLGR